MKQIRERLAFLLKAYAANQISPEELEELAELSRQPANDQIVEEVLAEYWKTMDTDESIKIQEEAIYHKITNHSSFDSSLASKQIKSIPLYTVYGRYAAAILILLTVGILTYVKLAPHKQNQSAQANQVNTMQMISGGTGKAVLTLADGSQVELKKSASGTVAFQADARVEQKDGELRYTASDKSTLPDSSVNILTTARGGFYALLMSDGTRVWLNAASRISYPVAFSKYERRVKVSGEAYFEVAKNPRKPFVVEANGSIIQVLGTHFNVSAYADDEVVTTTLLEGSVRVFRKNNTAMLRPGQQSLIRGNSDQIQIRNVETETAVAWKNGYFMFNNENIHSVMKQISRWYNVEISYKGDLSGKTFGGTISRFDDLNKLLSAIAMTEAVKFEVQGRRVTVMP